MNNPVREHLIGYLLNAAEPEEHALVEQQLQHDESLRKEVELLRASLHPLACDADHYAPPPGLAQRCCQYVFARTDLMPAALSPAVGSSGRSRRWSWLDVSVAGAVAAAALFLLVPAIYQSRLHSQLLTCQKNLQGVGAALASYSSRDPHGYYPAVSAQQPLNIGTLVKEGYLPKDATVCPAGTAANGATGQELSAEQLRAAQKESIEKSLSGSPSGYGYTLGFQDRGKPSLQHNLHRKSFPLSSDLPGKDSTNSRNHGGDGQNVLFEDGHVQYLKTTKVEGDDNIFQNDQGEIAPGLNQNDSVIVPDKASDQ